MFDVKKFRKEKGLTQNDFANQLGYARTTVANMEAGNQPVNDNFLDKLAEVFGIAVEEFKTYNQNKVTATNDSGDEYLNPWKEKYITLLEEYNALLLKHTRYLEENGPLRATDKNPSAATGSAPDEQ